MVCSFCVYWLYYKILFSLAYSCFSCCFVNCDDCTMYMSIYKCRCRTMWKSVDFILEIWFFLLDSLYVKQYTFLGCYIILLIISFEHLYILLHVNIKRLSKIDISFVQIYIKKLCLLNFYNTSSSLMLSSITYKFYI